MAIAKIPMIKTERTLLTVLQPRQAQLAMSYSVENRHHLGPWEPKRDGYFYSTVATQERVIQNSANFRSGVSVGLAVLNPEGTEMLGTCHFSNIVRGVFQACHLGYSVGQRFEGMGLMSEAVEAGIKYMFKDVGLHRIMANYMPHNQRSEKLLERLGFEREGYAKAYLNIAGVWEDHVLTALINRPKATAEEISVIELGHEKR